MIRVAYICALSLSILFSSGVGGSNAFLNIAPSAHINGNGNTLLSGSGLPSGLLYSPANIWNESSLVVEPSYRAFRYQDTSIDEYYSVFISKRLKRKLKSFVLGFGYIEYGVDDIYGYDSYANYEGSFSYGNKAVVIGLSQRVPSTNIIYGASFGMVQGGFQGNIDSHSSSSAHSFVRIGFRVSDIYIKRIGYIHPSVSINSVFDNSEPLEDAATADNTTRLGLGISRSIIDGFAVVKVDFDFKTHNTFSISQERPKAGIGISVNDINTPGDRFKLGIVCGRSGINSGASEFGTRTSAGINLDMKNISGDRYFLRFTLSVSSPNRFIFIGKPNIGLNTTYLTLSFIR